MGIDNLALLSTALIELEKGKFYELWYIPTINSNIVDFLKRQKKEDIDEHDKLLTVFKQFLKLEAPYSGVMKNLKRYERSSQFRDIFEIKNGGRLRVTGFHDGRRLILVRGFEKGTKKVQSREFKNANEIRKKIEGEQ